MSWERRRGRVSFDPDEAMKVIFGGKENSTYSSFLGKKDMRRGTAKTGARNKGSRGERQ